METAVPTDSQGDGAIGVGDTASNVGNGINALLALSEQVGAELYLDFYLEFYAENYVFGASRFRVRRE